MLISFVLMLLAVCFSTATAIKQIQQNEIDVLTTEIQRGIGKGVRKQRDYLIFTSSEEWMPSLMFSSIHTNSSSSSSVCVTLYRPPSPSHWLCFFYPEMNCIPNEGQQISITVQEQSHKKHRYKEVIRDCRGSVHPLAALVHKFNSGDR